MAVVVVQFNHGPFEVMNNAVNIYGIAFAHVNDPVFAFQFKIGTQVQSAHLFIVCQFFCRAMFEYFSFNQQIGAVTNRQCFIHIMVGNQYANVLVF